LKIVGKPLNDLIEAIKKGPLETLDDNEEDGGISFDLAAKEMLD
jgi:hypothetical protein